MLVDDDFENAEAKRVLGWKVGETYGWPIDLDRCRHLATDWHWSDSRYR